MRLLPLRPLPIPLAWVPLRITHRAARPDSGRGSARRLAAARRLARGH